MTSKTATGLKMPDMGGERAKWIVGLIMAPDVEMAEVEQSLTAVIGSFERRFGPYPFDLTSYYEEEMGPDLVRHWISAEGISDAAGLAWLKSEMMRIEEFFRRPAHAGSGRRVNLDPGYLTDAKLVLATHKNFSHRISLGRQVFAELTLCFSKTGIVYHRWTYPDFRSGVYDEALIRIRNDYLEQIHNPDMDSGFRGRSNHPVDSPQGFDYDNFLFRTPDREADEN